MKLALIVVPCLSISAGKEHLKTDRVREYLKIICGEEDKDICKNENL